MKKRETQKSKFSSRNLPKVDLPVTLMRRLVSYLLCTDLRNRAVCKKIYFFFQRIDLSDILKDPDLEILYVMIKTSLEMIVEEGIGDNELIIERLVNHPKFHEEITDICYDIVDEGDVVTQEEAIFIENEFIDRLNFIEASPIIANLKRSISRFEKNDYDSFKEIIEEIRHDALFYTKTLQIRSSVALSIPSVSFHDPNLLDTITNVHRSLTDEKRNIRTGVKRLNKMLRGGYQPGRLYVYLATSGGWKSGLLLNSMLWGSKYNSRARCRDQARKPLFLYLTQENDTEETLDRIFSYLGCTDQNGKISATPETIVVRLGEENLKSEKHSLEIRYYPKNSISAADIENIVREIESEGEFEVKLIVHDYLKRLRPNLIHGDIRLDLGEVTNDLSELAKALKVPIVTANQVNREAYNVMAQQGKNEHKNDLGRNASLTMQSESQQVTENADVVIAINREYSKARDEWFLTFTELKNRAAKGNQSVSSRYFVHPFVRGNSMRLREDTDTDESYSVESIAETLGDYDPNSGGGGSKPKPRRVRVTDEIEDE